jgi:hypothetical protein
MSDTAPNDPVEGGEPEKPLPIDGDQIRGEIESAREATERFRDKAAKLIEELSEREARARDEAARARVQAKSARREADKAIEEA